VTSSGTIIHSGSTYTITGGHTYSNIGYDNITLTVIDTTHPAAFSIVTPIAIVDATLTAGSSESITPIQNLAFDDTVATFTYGDTSAAPDDFSATITWGDGNISDGTVTGTDGSFAVSGENFYTNAGTYDASIEVEDNQGGNITMSATATVASITPSEPTISLIGNGSEATLTWTGVPDSGVNFEVEAEDTSQSDYTPSGDTSTPYTYALATLEESDYVTITDNGAISGSVDHSFSATVTGLIPGDTYEFRIRAEGTGFSVYSPEAEESLAAAPSGFSVSSSNVMSFSGSYGDDPAYSMEYYSPQFPYGDSHMDGDAINGVCYNGGSDLTYSDGEYQISPPILVAGATYYFRVSVDGSHYTSYEEGTPSGTLATGPTDLNISSTNSDGSINLAWDTTSTDPTRMFDVMSVNNQGVVYWGETINFEIILCTNLQVATANGYR
jgi:hypothetical protein